MNQIPGEMPEDELSDELFVTESFDDTYTQKQDTIINVF